MPELPDVAGFKQYLDSTSLHQQILSSECTDKRFIKGTSRRGLQQRLKGAELNGSRQWGKWLLVQLDTGGYLVLHFGMTGGLAYGSEDEALPNHARLILHFKKNKRLAILSQRMIGRASYTDDPQAFGEEHDLGPDALGDDLDQDAWLELMQGRTGSIKSALMNQSIVAGIGNVYSDEILFQSGIHPAAKVNKLDASDLKELFRAMRRVLRTACKRGGNGWEAPRSWLLGHRGEGKPCPRCDGKLEKARINGRSAYFCPKCQPKA